ncbi:hypothetical protein F1654_01555 [Alkalicaulis satelles]|uniref:Uncharacterized protein n=1 Tax=Alkalicaulis satelles TaxID=2609175 RepID=A0A5M6ZL82_9PROT|nr:hypothetical protein [Alkalicaulis satelles]KAA5804715.1 hypothetical protein F1654_01555 [Alkalicaulis satelles]
MLILLILALATPAQPQQADVRALARDAALAWNEGRLAEAGAHAAQAYDGLAATNCLGTPDGARLAFMAAIAAKAGQIEEPHGYFFWAASRLDRVARGLDGQQRRIARDYAIEPGLSPGLDPRFARSPFLHTPRPRRARGCEAVLPELNAASASHQAGILFARTRNPSNRYAVVRPVYAYPDSLRDMAAQIEGTYDMQGVARHNMIIHFKFTPCLFVQDDRGVRSELCPEGVSAP